MTEQLRMAALGKSLEHGDVECRRDGQRFARFFERRNMAVAGITEFPCEDGQGSGRLERIR